MVTITQKNGFDFARFACTSGDRHSFDVEYNPEDDRLIVYVDGHRVYIEREGHVHSECVSGARSTTYPELTTDVRWLD